MPEGRLEAPQEGLQGNKRGQVDMGVNVPIADFIASPVYPSVIKPNTWKYRCI